MDDVLAVLFKVQQFSQAKWRKLKLFESEPIYDESVPKVFITTPMPYADVRMSTNRALALVTTDIRANYHKLRGRNVLSALHFHFSGTIIQVCFYTLSFLQALVQARAQRLQFELRPTHTGAKPEPAPQGLMQASRIVNKPPKKGDRLDLDVITFLDRCGVPKDQLETFTDPLRWQEYFSEL